ncbi:hypothetical protein JOM56_001443 [Amanita muscaria]
MPNLTGRPDHYDHCGHYGHHGGRRPGGLVSLIGGVASALVGGHQRSRSAPPMPDMGYNNNQPGFPEARQYPAPGYPPPDRVQGSGPFLEPGYPPPRSFPEQRYTDDQFVPYNQSRSEDKSAGLPQQEYSPPPGPPPYTANPQSAPPSGFRVPLNTTTNFFPPPSDLGTPPCFDLDRSPLYFGSALFPRSVHPCKVGTHLGTHVLVAYGGREQTHSGRYDLLPFSPQTMELVRTSHGQIPPGRRPVEGGHEENEAKLYHAVATLQGVKVPGKTGSHLGGAIVGYEGEQLVLTDNYEILCWK